MSVSPHRLAVAAHRFPPAGAVDFAVTELLRRDLDLVPSFALPPGAMRPSAAHAGGLPHPRLFQHNGCKHVALVSGWTTNGSDLVIRADLFNAAGAEASLEQIGALRDPSPAIHSLAEKIASTLGAELSAADRSRLHTPSIDPGPAFAHFVRYWQGIYGDRTINWMSELGKAAEAGYPGALCYMSGWESTAIQIQGFDPDPRDALRYLEEAGKKDPYDIRAIAERASLLGASGRAAEALALVDRARKWAPNNAALWLRRMYAVDSLMLREEVAPAEEMVWSLAPFAPLSVAARSYRYYIEGRTEERRELLAQAHSNLPENLFLRYQYGVVLTEQRRWRDAFTLLDGLLNSVPSFPWHEMPFKVPHLDHHDSTRWALSYPLTLAAAGAGQEPTPYAKMHIELSTAPGAYGKGLGGVEGLVNAALVRATFRDPSLDEAAQAGPDGGIGDLATYAKVSAEVERGQQSGAAVDAILAQWSLDTSRWNKAQTFWSERIELDPKIAARFADLRKIHIDSLPSTTAQTRAIKDDS